MKNLWLSRGAAVIAVIALAGCGGGGGGGGGGAFLPLPITNTPNPAAPASVTLSGTATYDLVPNPNGALVYDALSAKPVRGAVVEVLNNASAVLATAVTDGNGAYSVSVPSGTQVVVRVKAQLLQAGSGAAWDVSVRDNTQSDAIYVIDSPAFSSGSSATLTRDLRATSGWGGTSYTGQRVAAPFAVLDTVYAAVQKVLAVAPGTTFPALRVFWSINNVPSGGNRALGQIGTTSFLNSGTSGRSIFVLGKEDVDTDEYDASVIAHEWGHYYQSAFSRDDSPGGDHSGSQRLDRRLAFSEGWGNAWSGIVLVRNNYTDSGGPGQAQGLNLDLSVGVASNPGWYRETSIQSIFWNLNQQVGFQPIHAAMTGSFKTTIAATSIHPFTAGFNIASPASTSALAGLLTAQGISAAPNDSFGTSETNAGGSPVIASALPMYVAATVGGTTTACVSNLAGAGNKLGSFVYLRVNAPVAGNRQIAVSGPAAADPDFEVYSGRLLAIGDGLGSTETATVGLLAGDNVVVINDYNNSGASTCFNVTIN